MFGLYGYYWDPTYLILLPAIIFTIYARISVNSTYSKYSTVYNRRGYTASEVARKILDGNGLNYVQVESTPGHLTDHFDPTMNVVRLSTDVYNSKSVASIGIAAHEVGHAIQHAQEYTPIKIRSAIIPITNIGANLSVPLIILGLAFSYLDFLIPIGIFLFAFVVFFQAITLPVEFNASNRALITLENFGILDFDEVEKSKKVLRAAAMTYVAALASALLSLLRLILLANRRKK